MSRRMQALVLFAAALIALYGWALFIAVFIESAPMSEPGENQSSAAEANSPEGQADADATEDQAQADGSEDQARAGGPLGGDWTLWWTNSEGDTSPAFGGSRV